MKYLLDSNAVIALLKGHERFLARLKKHEPMDFGISAIVVHELFYGAYKSQRTQQTLGRMDALAFEVVEFDREDARQAGELRARLARAGAPVGPYDVLIAGQSLARKLILVTHNRGDFEWIAELRLEDWK